MEVMLADEFAPVTIERLLKRYGPGRRRTRMEPIYRAVLAEAEPIGQPVAIYEEIELRQVPELLPWLPAETTYLFLALCSLGYPLQEHFVHLAQDDILSAAVLDEITLTWVTALTRQVHGKIRAQVGQLGLKAGAAYRPGVGRWPLAAQNVVFAHLPADAIAVTIDENLVMSPRHSTSLIIPVLDRR
ncbi:MAG: hypothetical protein R3293_12355 [Candidatus Promineifilaceae bacterium]|nr:hypothetical protein [Candidatus Promineifilaceae bacterium]